MIIWEGSLMLISYPSSFSLSQDGIWPGRVVLFILHAGVGWYFCYIVGSGFFSVLTNGLRSSNFSVGIDRATLLARCSLNVAIVLLAKAMRQNALISGILIGEREHKICLYTDEDIFGKTPAWPNPGLRERSRRLVFGSHGKFSWRLGNVSFWLHRTFPEPLENVPLTL